MAGLTIAETEGADMAIVQELNNWGVTIVMVERHAGDRTAARRIVVINFGEDRGGNPRPEEIIKDQRVIDAYFGGI